MNDPTSRRDSGFSLVELLVVIVVLGILATITVFAVRGLKDKSDQSACASDHRTMSQAMESRHAMRSAYTDEATLVAEGLLRDESQLHDVVLGANDYTLVPVGACAALAASTTTTT